MMCKFKYLRVALMDAENQKDVNTEENYAIDRGLDLLMLSWALYQKRLRQKAYQRAIYVQ